MKKQFFAIALILSYKLNGVGLLVATKKPVDSGRTVSNSKPIRNYGQGSDSTISVKQVKGKGII